MNELKSIIGLTALIFGITIVPLWLINVISNFKSLKREFPEALEITFKQLTISQLILLPFSIFPSPFELIHKLKEQQIFLEWDIRWGPHGQTIGILKDIQKTDGKISFLLHLFNPVECFQERKYDQMYFIPYSQVINKTKLLFGKLNGYLLPTSTNEKIDCKPTASLVIIGYKNKNS